MYKPRERYVMKMMFCLSNVGFLVATIENRASRVGCEWHTCVVGIGLTTLNRTELYMRFPDRHRVFTCRDMS